MERELLGARVGQLTVAEQLPPDRWRRQRWRCICQCGGEIILTGSQIRAGAPTHCGCQKSPMRSDLTGQQFGKLTVLGPSALRGPRGKRTVPLWECRCQCGEICYKATDTLTGTKNGMCNRCAQLTHAQKARQKAGYVAGTQVTKLRPSTLSSANTSGATGVFLDKKSGKWRAQIGFQGRKIKLGYFTTFEDACKARQRAEELYFEPILEAADPGR